MNNRNIKFAVFIIFLTAFNLYGQKLKPSDFAWGVSVKIDNKNSFYRFPVPKTVYEGMKDQRLNDLVMFNGTDEMVPYILRKGDSFTVTEEKKKDIKVPFFPLHRSYKRNEKKLSVHIATNKEGSIIDINEKLSKGGTKKRVKSYILDFSKIKKRPYYLTFRFNRTDNFNADIRVLQSYDLSYFSTIVREKKLLNMEYGGNRFVKKRVYLPHFNGKYLKIEWLKNSSDIGISEIKARISEDSEIKRVDGVVVNPVVKRDNKNPSEYRIRLDGFYPVDRVKIKLPQKNSVVKYTLFSGSSFENVWSVSKGVLYRLNFGGSPAQNDDIYLTPSGNRYWILKIDDSQGGIGERLPMVKMEYHPHVVVFAARGEGPFKLAYGNNSDGINGRNSTVIDQLTNGKKSFIRDALIGENLVFGGERVFLPPKKPFPVQKYILWGVLIIGVAITAFMAIKLLKQMNEN